MSKLYLSRWTFNANAEKLGDEQFYARTLTAWRPPAQFLMNGLKGSSDDNVVVRLGNLARLWNAITVYRPYQQKEIEGKLWENVTVDEHLRFIKDHRAPDWIWWNVGNEPAPKEPRRIRDMSEWKAELIYKLVENNLNGVIPNFPVGGFEYQSVEDGDYDKMLLALAKTAHLRKNGFNQIMLGTHSAYGMGVLPVHTAGRDPNDLMHPERLKKANWPTREQIYDDTPQDNYILFRDVWFTNRIRKLQALYNINVGKDVQIGITECGPERLPNIVQQFPHVAAELDKRAGREMRGIPTMEQYWRWAFPDMKPEDAWCEQKWWLEQVAHPLYVFLAIFQWTTHDDGKDNWSSNYSPHRWGAYLSRWPIFVKEQETAVETKPTYLPPKGKPSNSTPYRAVVQFEPTGARPHVNLREGPNADAYKDIGDVLPGTLVNFYPALEGDWAYVEVLNADGTGTDRAGWVSGQGGQVTFEKVIPVVQKPPPAEPEPTQEVDKQAELLSVLLRIAVSLEKLVAFEEARMKAVTAKSLV